MRKIIRLFPLIGLSALLLSISGCSQRISALNDTIALAYYGNPDIVLTPEQIKANPYASIYAKIEGASQVFITLAFAEPKTYLNSTPTQSAPLELKWLSADKAMLVTINGRLVKTHKLVQGNLVSVESTEPDPILLGLHLNNTPKQWTRTIDWQPGYHYGYTLNSQFKLVAEEVVMINESPKTTLHYSEFVSVDSLNIQYQNEFWVDPKNGRVIKSWQKIAPNLPYIEMILLKPFAS
ncbi:YjbF family lipoprotein [Shewanella acanthi]|uniref:YjbF family lipoprotein n=1 Tax=Shewanella acanthi TaxID=2864212 RepID=UPI001C6622AC|nr:YjbF family lipoprotein [Shewanella acanthi]QYJ79945.1 YjbF family lipoprotein [Shewanella acanthi]